VKSALAPTVPTQLSLEERMACGVGACYACVVGDARDPDHQFRGDERGVHRVSL
ncbi:iron-sulfur cluster-binding protein, partial [Cutibacterium namnetense]|uniref:iron-sulfur cluster-binding protein n=1 Tax=Cutibacterium namnetense TaxID=1574624 RepID=UPI003F975237